MRRGRLAFAAILLVIACDAERNPADVAPPQAVLVAPGAESEFTVIDLGSLGGGWSNPGENGALNNRGQVVGTSQTAVGEVHAFLWDNGVMTDLGTTGQRSQAYAINERGQIIGHRYEECGPYCSPYHGVVWEHGVMTDLGMIPTAINDIGQVIGYAIPAGKGYLWERGVKTDLGNLTLPLAINNAGQIVGSNGGGPVRAMLWKDGMTIELGSLGGGVSQATAINSRGQVVGNGNTASGDWHAFMWENGVLTDLGTLGGASATITPGDIIPGAINDRGQVAGISTTTAGDGHAFLWEKGVMTDLGTPAGTERSVGWVINDASEMIGTYEAEGDDYVFVWAKGVMNRLPGLPGAMGSWPAGINSVGQIVGSSGGHAVVWQRRPRANAGT